MGALHVAISVLCGSTGGPATYGKRLVAALAARDDVRITVLTDEPAAFASDHIAIEHLPMRGGLDRLRWQFAALPRALRTLRPDVYHDTKNALPFALRVPAVVTVHDLAYHTVPESFGFGSRTFLRWATKHAVRRAQGVIVPSHATANDLRRVHPECAGRIHVVPHGIDPAATFAPEQLAAVRARLRLPERFVLHVGTIQARKNVDLVVDGVALLRQRGFSQRTVVVGRKGWLAAKALHALERDPTALWLEHVSGDDLAAIYALADAFVSPSAYEGFGFAVADAMAAGVPTVISDISSLPELCGQGAVRLASLSAVAVADALASLLADPARQSALIAAARQRAASFSWAAAAEGHRRVFAAAAANTLRVTR